MTKHDSPVPRRYDVTSIHTSSKIILSISASVKRVFGALFGAQEPRSPTPPPPPQTLVLKPPPGAIPAAIPGAIPELDAHAVPDPDPTEQDAAEGG